MYILTVRPAFLGAVTTVVAHNKLRRFDLVLSDDMNDQLHMCSNKGMCDCSFFLVVSGGLRRDSTP